MFCARRSGSAGVSPAWTMRVCGSLRTRCPRSQERRHMPRRPEVQPRWYKTPSTILTPCTPHRGDKVHEYGDRGESGLCDLPAIVIGRDADVVALPRRKRNMAGRPSICPATLGNVNCPGRLVQPGGAAIFIAPLLYPLRNSNEPVRWTSMRAPASSSDRSLMGM